jgi:hypothetical protein
MSIVYLEDKFKGFQKHIPIYFMNAWFERDQSLKIVILVKIVKIGKLQMGVVTLEPIMHSGFSSFKTFSNYS